MLFLPEAYSETNMGALKRPSVTAIKNTIINVCQDQVETLQHVTTELFGWRKEPLLP